MPWKIQHSKQEYGIYFTQRVGFTLFLFCNFLNALNLFQMDWSLVYTGNPEGGGEISVAKYNEFAICFADKIDQIWAYWDSRFSAEIFNSLNTPSDPVL